MSLNVGSEQNQVTEVKISRQACELWKAGREAAEKVREDSLRPAYHFRAPAMWMNDPNGTIYHEGWYHMFYQHNPYEDDWGRIHWGHARSRDLLHWEHLPMALIPAYDRGEEHCWSGCAWIMPDGRPRLYYTSIGKGKDPYDGAEQWIATGDRNLIDWSGSSRNPVMTEELHGNLKVYDWRDPYMFVHEGRVYMILGGNLNQRKGGEGVVLLYCAKDEALLDWDYLGIIYRSPDVDVVQLDCPNLFKVDGKWVIVFSPWHGHMQYVVGHMDFETPQFIPETNGVLDYGSDLFATNTLYDDEGRMVLWAWVRGFTQRRGWQGCLCLPRTLSIGKIGEIRQQPCVEVEKLRQETAEFEGRELAGEWTLPGVQGDTLEVECEFTVLGAKRFGIRLMFDERHVEHPVEIFHDAKGVSVAGNRILAVRKDGGQKLSMRIFLDRSVVEAYLDGGRYVSTRVVYPEAGANHVQFFCEGGRVHVGSIKIHRLQQDGLFSDWSDQI